MFSGLAFAETDYPLVGLVPVFVGMGLLSYALVEKARADARKARARPAPPPPRPASSDSFRITFSAMPEQVVREREIIREIVKIPCRHCGSLIENTSVRCPFCDAPVS
jgi:rubrerythrin